MNIIQVGRPAVSRYHQIHKFDPVGEGPDFAVHDFPNAKYGIKFRGIYVQEALSGDKVKGEKKAR